MDEEVDLWTYFATCADFDQSLGFFEDMVQEYGKILNRNFHYRLSEDEGWTYSRFWRSRFEMTDSDVMTLNTSRLRSAVNTWKMERVSETMEAVARLSAMAITLISKRPVRFVSLTNARPGQKNTKAKTTKMRTGSTGPSASASAIHPDMPSATSRPALSVIVSGYPA